MDGALCWKMFKIIQLLDSGSKELEGTLNQSLCCVFRHWHLPLCHIRQTPGLICSQKHTRKATGKARTALLWWARKFIRIKFSPNGYLSPRVFETNQVQCNLPNPKQSYNLLIFLMDFSQAQGPCKMSVLHTRSARGLLCPEAGEHLQSWKLKANKTENYKSWPTCLVYTSRHFHMV